MIVSINQPAYLPWLGYFDRIAASNLFIFLDTVQFERNSFTNRNRIKTANGPTWLTVPVRLKDHLTKPLKEIEIDTAQPWKKKHLRSVEQNYSKAPQFLEKFARLGASYAPDDDYLAELCLRQLQFWLDELKIGTPVVRSSALPVIGTKSDLVLALCRHVGATIYLSGQLGRSYLKEERFADAKIEIRYHDFVHPVYSQLFGDFVPAMGVVDYWMNCAPGDLFRRVG